MATQIKDLKFSIYMNNDSAKKALLELENNAKRLVSELDNLEKTGQKGTPAWLATKKAMRENAEEMMLLKQKAGLLAMSYNDLNALHRQTMAEWKKAIPGGEHRDRLQKELTTIKNRMDELKGKSAEAGFSLSKMAEGVNKYWLSISTGIATFTGIGMSINKLAENVAKMDDVYADVMKTTGMTHAQTVQLNEEFKKMDTRTSREELNKLASEAGKLGKSSTKDVMDFVEAGNQIRVALGEDLGKDAIIEIGKIAEVFKKSQKDIQNLDLKGQMLSIGSAINALGNDSSASEPYLVEFTKRMAGIASQSGISMQSILGFGSALDQAGQNVEMSATALQGFIIKIFEDPAKFAKMAGQDVKEFTTLLHTDANKAITSVITSLNQKGGFEALIPVFNDMQLDGKRAVSVLATLATNVDLVTRAQDVANREFIKGNSITKEYNTKNQNLQAELDKARKRFSDISLELGEKLSPSLIGATHFAGTFLRIIVEIIKFAGKHSVAIASASTAIGIYSVAMGAAYLWNLKYNEALVRQIALTALKTAWDRTATAATALHSAAVFALNGNLAMAATRIGIFFRILGLNPYVAVVAGIAAIGVAIYKLVSQSKTYMQLQDSLINIQKKVDDGMTEHKSKIDVLVAAVHDENLAHGKRLEAIRQLKELVPKYTAEISKEGKVIGENKKALDDYIASMEKEIRLTAAKEELMDLARLERKQKKELDIAKKSQANAQSNVDFEVRNGTSPESLPGLLMVLSIAKSKTEDFNNALKSTREAIKSITKEVAQGIDIPTNVPKEGDKSVIDGVPCTFKGGKWVKDKPSGGGGDDTDKKKLDNELKQRENAWKTAIADETSAYNALAKNKKDIDAMSEKELEEYNKLRETQTEAHNDKLDAIELEHLKLKRQTLLDNKQAVGEIDAQIAEKQASINAKALKQATEHFKNLSDVEKKEKEKQLKQLDLDEKKEKEKLDKSRASNLISEELYQLELLRLAEKYRKERNKIAGISPENKNDATIGSTSERDWFEKTYPNANNNKKEQLKRQHEADIKDILDMEMRGVITHNEATKAKWEIDARYFENLAEGWRDTADVISSISGGLSTAAQGFQQAEEMAIERKYKKLIKAAGKNSKQVAELEEKKEQELASVKAKWADKQFILTAAQITASTAVAAMNAYASMALVGGPILGAIAAAAAVAAGAAQLAVANQARENAKEGYFKGGYTGGNDPREVRGYFPDGEPYHGKEFVGNHNGVENPHVRQFYDIFDVAQKNGTIRMLNTSQILKQITTPTNGKYDGGYTRRRSSPGTDQPTQPTRPTDPRDIAVLERVADTMERLIIKLDEPLEVPIAGKKGIAEGIKRYNKLLANKDRG